METQTVYIPVIVNMMDTYFVVSPTGVLSILSHLRQSCDVLYSLAEACRSLHFWRKLYEGACLGLYTTDVQEIILNVLLHPQNSETFHPCTNNLYQVTFSWAGYKATPTLVSVGVVTLIYMYINIHV